ncbi:MAG: hypothetical protein ACREBI_06270 [Nitrosotalea sp.]
MSTKTIGIIIAGFTAGAVAIAVAMLAGSGWETPGTYAGVSDASHVNNSTNCYSFQTGCSHSTTNVTASDMSNGQYLSGSYNAP